MNSFCNKKSEHNQIFHICEMLPLFACNQVHREMLQQINITYWKLSNIILSCLKFCFGRILEHSIQLVGTTQIIDWPKACCCIYPGFLAVITCWGSFFFFQDWTLRFFFLFHKWTLSRVSAYERSLCSVQLIHGVK